MSTTVTYKGSTLTTVNNQTRTLKTAGKYMEDDVQLTDTTSTIVVSETYDTNGGIIKTITTTGEVNLQAKTITPTTSVQTVNPDTGYDGFSQVIVNAGGGGSIINNQDKTVTPTTSQQSIIADSGYTGLGTVTVNPIPSYYQDIPKFTVDFTASPATAGCNKTYSQCVDFYNTDHNAGVIADITTSNGLVRFAGSVAVYQLNAYIFYTVYTETGAPAFDLRYYPNGTIAVINPSTLIVDAGTPTATKGTVSNHSVSVTPSVTNTTGYITGGTKTGTAVTVSANELVSGNKTISANGTDIDVTNYATVSVAVGSDINNQNKTVTPTESQQSITADSGYSGLGTVTVNAISSTYIGSNISQLDSSDLTVSGATVTAPAGYYAEAASKSVSSMTLPTSAASSATSGYTSKATIGRSTSAQYINIPPGYNSAGAYYVISATPNGSVTAPSSISGTTATISTGSGTLTLTKTISVTPNVTTAGYISSGTAGNSSVSLTANVTINPTPTASGATVTIPAGYYTQQTTKAVSSGSATAPSTISGTAASVSTGTNTLTFTKTVSVTPVVSAGYVSAGTAGNASVSLTASVTTKAAATYTPTTTNQTIAAGTYLTGAQTIAGDADLVGPNIVQGAQIFGINGTATFQSYYTGSSAPSSSLGSNGDIYLQE